MGTEVLVSRVGTVTVVSINRPEVRNAVNGPTARALFKAFTDFDAEETSSVAILRGEGGHFCAGADLKALAGGSSDMNSLKAVTGPHGSNLGPMGPSRLQLSKPVIACVEGAAVAGGLELACWADLRVMDATSVMGVFCRRWGVPLIDGGTVRLPRLIGESRASDLILTGRPVYAKEALAVGLVNRVAPEGQALNAALDLAMSIASFPQVTVRSDRESSIAQAGLSERDALQLEYELGLKALQQAGKGAGVFTQGKGRHGDFEENLFYKAIYGVVFDIGGVICDSPVSAILAFEHKHGLPKLSVSKVMLKGGSTSLFAQLETGQISYNTFLKSLQDAFGRAGFGPSVTAEELFSNMDASLRLRKPVLDKVADLRRRGYCVAALTNNWNNPAMGDAMNVLKGHFDVFVESVVVGMRKPDPNIFIHTCKAMSIDPRQAVMLDDLGVNLKGAQSVGMHTVKVTEDFSAALVKLEEILSKNSHLNHQAVNSTPAKL